MISLKELEAVVTADTSDFDDKMAEAKERLQRRAEDSAETGKDMHAVGVGLAAIGDQAATGFTEVVSAAEDFEEVMRRIGADTSRSAREAAEAVDRLCRAKQSD